MQSKLLKSILDIESIIEEIEYIKQKTQNDFNNFSDDIILQRAVERDLEIIGEAIRLRRSQNFVAVGLYNP